MPTDETGEQRLDEKEAREETLQWFSQKMREKLDANAHKGSWRDFRIDYLMHRLEGEYVELKIAESTPMGLTKIKMKTKGEAIIDECRDIANFAMMIADVAKLHYGVD